jgi:hypothetical protein
MLDAEVLTAERRGLYFPVAGAVFWGVLGGPPVSLVGPDVVWCCQWRWW